MSSLREWKRIAAAGACMAVLSAAAQEKACSPGEMSAAEKAIDRVVNFETLYKAYKDYRHCDKGNAQELYAEAVLRCLIEWKHVDVLARQVQADADYRKFLEKHLKGATKDDLNAVYSRAKASCPKGLDAFCTDLAALATPDKK